MMFVVLFIVLVSVNVGCMSLLLMCTPFIPSSTVAGTLSPPMRARLSFGENTPLRKILRKELLGGVGVLGVLGVSGASFVSITTRVLELL